MNPPATSLIVNRLISSVQSQKPQPVLGNFPDELLNSTHRQDIFREVLLQPGIKREEILEELRLRMNDPDDAYTSDDIILAIISKRSEQAVSL